MLRFLFHESAEYTIRFPRLSGVVQMVGYFLMQGEVDDSERIGRFQNARRPFRKGDVAIKGSTRGSCPRSESSALMTGLTPQLCWCQAGTGLFQKRHNTSD